MVYRPGIRWDETYPPKPDFVMHQLQSSKVEAVMPYLDSERFAEVVLSYLKEMEDST